MIPLVLGIEGYQLTNREREILPKIKPAGFTLFKRNIESKDQVKKLIQDLIGLFNHKIIICVDEEGGRVSRMSAAKIIERSSFPSAGFFYELYRQKGLKAGKKAVYNNYLRISKIVSSLGFDTVFAPVADLLDSNGDKVIGDRSFGPEVDVVIELCHSAFEGLEDGGVAGCMKHIPGHGLATCNSHKELPKVDVSLEILEKRDFKIFRELANRLKNKQIMAMAGHMVYTELDKDKPVTTSKKAVKYIREKLIGDMPLITDCMSMKAIGDVTSGVLDAYKAGFNFILYSHGNLDEVIKIHDAISKL